MKWMLVHTMLAAGFLLFANGNAFAYPPGGGGARGGGGGHEGVAGPAHVEEGPAVRSEVRTPALGNEGRVNQALPGNEGRALDHGAHPFYGNDRAGENDWRYRFNDGRWWYWTPLGAWAYWNDGRWADYSAAVPYTTNYRGPTAPTGWYWNNDQQRYYWFDGTNLTAAQQ